MWCDVGCCKNLYDHKFEMITSLLNDKDLTELSRSLLTSDNKAL